MTHPTVPGSGGRVGRFWFVGGSERESMILCQVFGVCWAVGCAGRTDGQVDRGSGCSFFEGVAVGCFFLPIGREAVPMTHPTGPGNSGRVGRFWFVGGAERESMILCQVFGPCRAVGCVIRTDAKPATKLSNVFFQPFQQADRAVKVQVVLGKPGRIKEFTGV